MYFLGLSFGYHDSSAAIINDSKIIAVAQEERFTRIKHDSNFPYKAIEFCLNEAGITLKDITQVIYYEDNYQKLDRAVGNCLESNNYIQLAQVIDSYISGNKIDIKSFISTKLNIQKEKVFTLQHHLSHASCFLLSNFQESAILTVDGVGEYETLSIYDATQTSLKKIYTQELPHSIGLLYSAFTSFLGFEVNEGEYKVMGLSSYGEAKYKNLIYNVLDIDKKKKIFEIKMEYFDFNSLSRMYTDKFIELFGEAKVDSDYDLSLKKDKFYADLAASLQSITEDLVLMFAKKALELTNRSNLCISGGVALNSVSNEKIKNELSQVNLFIPPDPGDGGSSLFCALYYAKYIEKVKGNYQFETPFLGQDFSYEEIKKQLYENYTGDIKEVNDKEEFLEKVSDLLLDNNVIGWFYGKFEWGPRALGHRSIIANPKNEYMRDRINLKIKFREAFRPFAPSVLNNYATDYFDVNKLDLLDIESYMLGVADVFENKRDEIAAVVHVDGTGRLQTVWKENNEMYYELIDKFYKKSGTPIILNTSFNLKGEPVVTSPKDAILTFSYSYMDYLAIYPFIIKSFGVKDE